MTEPESAGDRPADDPEPSIVRQWDDQFCPLDVLDYVRRVTAQRDPRHAALYETTDASRIKDAVDVLQTLLRAHLTFHQRTGRGARSGKRAHRQQIDAAVLGTNEATYHLGLTWLELAFGLLPSSPPPEDD
jgi:hypothetical protein